MHGEKSYREGIIAKCYEYMLFVLSGTFKKNAPQNLGFHGAHLLYKIILISSDRLYARSLFRLKEWISCQRE